LYYSTALEKIGEKKAAAAAYRKSLTLFHQYKSPDFNNLGFHRAAHGDFVGAEAAYRKAIELKPHDAEAHYGLGVTLTKQGRFAEALASYRQAHQIGSRLRDWKYPSAQWVKRAEFLARLEKQLPAVLKGEISPANNAERLTLAWIAGLKKQYHAAQGLYAEAFRREPARADQGPHRYNAACAAALAAAGKGIDAGKLDDKEKARLRGQALTWLRAELAVGGKYLEKATPAGRARIRRTLRHWQRDPDLAGVRGNKALAMLQETERAGWRKLWAEVEALLKKTGENPGKK
jgi:tetratricopeptide (TPR) repeat protein